MQVLAACHIHSKWSYDGSWTLEALAAQFAERGYRVLLMTEHDRGFSAERFAEYRQACAQASSEKILLVPGIEYSDAANRVHILVWGPVPFLGENLPTGGMLQKAHGHGGLAVFAHPTRKDAWKTFDPAWKQYLLGVEMWNRKYDGWAPSKTAPELQRSTGAVPFVGLDFHTARQLFALGMALDLRGEPSEETIVEALRARNCSPQALGKPLDQSLSGNRLPMLQLAERGRKTAARVVRYARGRK